MEEWVVLTFPSPHSHEHPASKPALVGAMAHPTEEEQAEQPNVAAPHPAEFVPPPPNPLWLSDAEYSIAVLAAESAHNHKWAQQRCDAARPALDAARGAVAAAVQNQADREAAALACEEEAGNLMQQARSPARGRRKNGEAMRLKRRGEQLLAQARHERLAHDQGLLDLVDLRIDEDLRRLELNEAVRYMHVQQEAVRGALALLPRDTIRRAIGALILDESDVAV